MLLFLSYFEHFSLMYSTEDNETLPDHVIILLTDGIINTCHAADVSRRQVQNFTKLSKMSQLLTELHYHICKMHSNMRTNMTCIGLVIRKKE